MVDSQDMSFSGADELSRSGEGYLFPYDTIRSIQKELIEQVYSSLKDKSHMIIHAPTGLGKTAATLAPALKYAIDNDKRVFFLTSRHTQHIIAIETLKEIKEKYDIDFTAVDIIGKKWMCSVAGIDGLFSNQFSDYCKKQREEGKCEFYNNTKKGNKLTVHGQLAVEQVQKESPCHVERIKEIAEQNNTCAYEVAMAVARDARVFVADYFYMFNPFLRDMFFKKGDFFLNDCIVIVDEAHNLPDRIRNLMTTKLSNVMIKKAISEAKKLGDEELIPRLSRLQDVLNHFSDGMKNREERLVSKTEFVSRVSSIYDYDELVADLDGASQVIKKEAKQSSLAAISQFLDLWKGQDTGYVRIISQLQIRQGVMISLSYRCLDPSQVSAQVIPETHSTIMMSGTLTPTSMYHNLLGFPDNTLERVYKSPFPQSNRINIIVPETTTKFSARSPAQFRHMAQILAQVTDQVPGNSALFFPSYFLRDQVYQHLVSIAKKTILVERPDMTKDDKMEFLDRFRQYQKSGAVLMGVVSGSYGEGIDFPGDLLKCVVVVGLPLQIPTLETKKLIEYYDLKFGKGWEYGYVAPAFTKCLQSAGRCIRSETDRGLVMFLDQRYSWSNYYKYFPSDWDLKVTKSFLPLIRRFFGE